MKVLVGVPVFRIPDLVRSCLASLIATPADVLVVDNNSDGDVKKVLRSYRRAIRLIANGENTYCNGGWNQIMKYGLDNGYDVVGLGSSDVVLHPGWYEALQSRFISFSNEVWLPSLSGMDTEVEYVESVAGYFSFLPRVAVQLVYPIPKTLRHWYGDQYFFEKLSSNGWKIAVLRDLKAQHQQSAVTAATPEAYAVIEEDKIAWNKLNDSGELR